MSQAYGKAGQSETAGAASWRAAVAAAVGDAFLAERDRWVLWCPVGLGCGIALYFALPAEPAPEWGITALVLAVASGWLARRNAALLGLCLCLGLVFAGFSLAQWRTASVAAPVLTEETRALWLTARVLRVEERQTRVRLLLAQPVIEGPSALPRLERIRLSMASKRLAVAPGDWLRLRAVLRPPSPPVAPGSYDFARRAYFERIGAVGFVLGHAEPAKAPAGLAAPPGLFAEIGARWERLRQRISQRLRADLGGQEGAVAAALIVGDRSGLSEATTQNLRDSGLAHLLAISGLHLGLMAGTFFFAMRFVLALIPPLALRYPIKKWAAVGALIVAFVYMLLAGATVPAQRAFLMIAIVFLAILIDRNAISLRLVAWAATVLLVLSPELLLSVSFQLSFAAVACLVAAYEHISDRRRLATGGWLGSGEGGWLQSLARYLGNVGLATVIATLATTPFAVYHFNRLAWFGLLANLIAVPVTALWIMPLALVTLLLMPFGLDGPFVFLMGLGITLLLWVAETVASWPGAISLLPSITPLGLGLLVMGGLWLIIWRRRWRWLGLPFVLAGWSTVAVNSPPQILVSQEARMIALQGPDGHYYFNRLRGGRFVRESWLEDRGQDKAAAAERGFDAAGEDWLRCDALGCRALLAGRSIAIVRQPLAFREDCRRNDIVLSFSPAPAACASARSPPARVIDRGRLAEAKALAIWFDGEAVRLKSVAQVSGRRPWAWWSRDDLADR